MMAADATMPTGRLAALPSGAGRSRPPDANAVATERREASTGGRAGARPGGTMLRRGVWLSWSSARHDNVGKEDADSGG